MQSMVWLGNSYLTLMASVAALLTSLVFHVDVANAQEPSATIDFQRDIRPILSDTCYKCHGPDGEERKADLRLDTEEGLFDSSMVVPNEPASSELYLRIVSEDEDTLMPPPKSGRKLTDTQKDLIKRWIEQGANWQNHWSLRPANKPDLPTLKPELEAHSKNAIDHFVLAELDKKNLQPSPIADRATLIRRVSFDLTGLPPTSERLKKYLVADSESWYEQLVDELLADPAYGEHMARYWLDAARYGDTHGLHLDNYREMWLYRDWVVAAFNENKSYRDFTIEQLAGDMLPDPSQSQIIASGFNRAHVTTNEGGSITEEVYVRNVVDRVSTTGTVFMGLTVGCAQCHDHKFDPISQKEFYQLFAYFNNLTDPPMDKNVKDPQPVIRVMDETMKAQSEQLTNALATAEKELENAINDYDYVDTEVNSEAENPQSEDPQSEDPQSEPAKSAVEQVEEDTEGLVEFIWVDGGKFPSGITPGGSYELASGDNIPAITKKESRKQSGSGTIQHYFTEAVVPLTVSEGDTFFADVYLDPENPPTSLMLQFNDGNWEHRMYWGVNAIDWGADNSNARRAGGELPEVGKWVRLKVPVAEVGFKKESSINGMAFTQFGGTAYWDTAGVISKHPQSTGFSSLSKWIEFVAKHKPKNVPGPLKKILETPLEKRSPEQVQSLRRHFLLKVNSESMETFSQALKAVEDAKKKLDEFNRKVPTTLVSKEANGMKESFVLLRGEYDQKGEKVERKTPAALPPMDASLPNDRLGFARWLTSGQHPLTARVAVNRFWQQIFGFGIVKTSEDFGAQGDNPSHPELLDWLAVDFVENDWDVRRLIKQIVMSSTYQQSSAAPATAYQSDPENRWLARGPRFRLDAESLRDQALAIGGLLNTQMGGPSVKPPQPDGLWFAVGYSGSNTVRFKADQGADKVYRRSLYTFWKRTAAPPQLTTFDAPSREECRVRRERTNTPLQALLLMNEPQYLAAAHGLAKLAIQQPVESMEARLAFMFERALGRTPEERETNLLSQSFASHMEELQQSDHQAEALLLAIEKSQSAKAESKTKMADETHPSKSADQGSQPRPVELAAMTMVASLIMNTDEFLNKN